MRSDPSDTTKGRPGSAVPQAQAPAPRARDAFAREPAAHSQGAGLPPRDDEDRASRSTRATVDGGRDTKARGTGSRSPSILISTAVLVLLTLGGLALVAELGAGSASHGAVDARGEEFVRLALAFAQHEPAEVDAYFGPDSLRPTAKAARIPLPELSRRAHHLANVLDRIGNRVHRGERESRLLAQTRALMTTIDQRASGMRGTFDEEARAMYGMSLDEPDTAKVEAALRDLDRLLPGAGALPTRFAAYRARFAVPPDRRRALFAAAVDACRARTIARLPLPSDERFDVKWDLTAPGAWHRYDGHHHSTLTINPGAVEFIDTAIDLACHEGYPGHHAQFLLVEQQGRRQESARATPSLSLPTANALPIEDTIALLRSPVTMLREGAAQYAVDLAFPADERVRFERDVLFPIAGFDPTDAARYFEVRQLVRALEPAIVPVLRDYRDGRLSATEAATRLEQRTLVSSPQALLHFVDDLGPYVLGYTTARARVATHITHESTAGHGDPWTLLRTLLAPPDITVLRVHPQSTLLIGGDGIPVETFLSTPVSRWAEP
jgi:hypothetical protein